MKRSRILAEVYESAAGMRRSGSIDEKTMREFDALMFPALDDSAWRRMAKQLNVAMEDPNPRVFLTALGAVIETIGLEPAAQRLGVTAASLARVVGPRATPSFEEVRAVVSGLGFRWGWLNGQPRRRNHRAGVLRDPPVRRCQIAAVASLP